MRPDQCLTAIHIDVWHERALPRNTTPVTLRMVLRGSLLPILVWLGAGVLASFLFGETAALALGGLFVLFVLTGFALRRRANHSVRCSIYGAVAGVLDKSLTSF